MKIRELALAGFVYLVSVTLVYFILRRFNDDATGLAQVVGAVAGADAAIWLYQSRSDALAPVKVKLLVGGTLALLCIIQGLLFQRWLHWMAYPDINISVAALGTLCFPFGLWNTFGKSVPRKK